MEFALEQQGQATRVEMKIDYSVPGGIFGKIATKLFLERMNQKTIEKSAEGLKIFCES